MILENDKEMTFCICEEEPETEAAESKDTADIDESAVGAKGGYMKWLLGGLGIGAEWSTEKFWAITCVISGIVLGCCSAVSSNLVNIGYVSYINLAESFAMLSGLYCGILGAAIAAVISLAWGFNISAAIAAVIGAAAYYIICDKKFAKWYHALPFIVMSECVSMLSIILQNRDNISTGIDVLNHTAYWMFALNAVFTTLVVLLISLINRKRLQKTYNKETGKRTYKIARIVRGALAITTVAVLTVTVAFGWVVQTGLAIENANNMLECSIQDISESVAEQTDQQIIELANFARQDYKYFGISQANTEIIAKLLGLAEINVVNPDGIIVYSNLSGNIGYDMHANPESSEFLVLRKSSKSIVQPFRKSTIDSFNGAYIKYAGAVLWDGYFIQIGLLQNAIGETMSKEIALAAHNRHVGSNGVFYITSEYGYIYSSTDHVEKRYLAEALGTNIPLKEEGKMSTFENGGETYYYLFRESEGCKIVGIMSEAEVMESRDLFQWLSITAEIVAFGILFMLIEILIRNLVVRQLKTFNEGLHEITEGNLDVRIEPGMGNVVEYCELAGDVNDTVDKLKELIAEAEERIEKDLNLAKDIQREALPGITNAFPKETRFAIHATMDPAKEVGGDFYDFYFTDKGKVAFLVADVSGKGIPAAMFMMKTKSIIKGYAQRGTSVEEILRQTNNELCAQNDAGMFVTCWMCIVDLETGNAEFCNAGHNPPLIRRADGSFEYLKGKVNLVLAAMDNVPYYRSEIHLNPGDEIFLYTDGVTEATNVDNELYGEDRLKDCLNREYSPEPNRVCSIVKEDLDRFVGEADQFDDITMLSFKFKG